MVCFVTATIIIIIIIAVVIIVIIIRAIDSRQWTKIRYLLRLDSRDKVFQLGPDLKLKSDDLDLP